MKISTLSLIVFAWLDACVGAFRSNFSVISAVYGEITDQTLLCVENFMSFQFQSVVYGDNASISQLRSLWPPIKGRRSYVVRDTSDFVLNNLLVDSDGQGSDPGDRSDRVRRRTINVEDDKVFILVNAISENKYSSEFFAWVNIELFSRVELFPFFVGFPSIRAMRMDVLTMAGVFVAVEGSIAPHSILADTSVIVGGTAPWLKLRQKYFDLVVDTDILQDSDSEGIPGSHNIHSDSTLLLQGVIAANPSLFCVSPTPRITMGGHALPATHYLLHLFSYTSSVLPGAGDGSGGGSTQMSPVDSMCIDTERYLQAAQAGDNDLSITYSKVVAPIRNARKGYSGTQCNENQFLFFGKCFCNPGRGGDDCSGQLGSYNGCPCEQVGVHNTMRCAQLCSFSEDAGIVRTVDKSLWRTVNEGESQFWKTQGRDSDHDRKWEHIEGFKQYDGIAKYLRSKAQAQSQARARAVDQLKSNHHTAAVTRDDEIGLKLSFGKVLEVGAGPFTQSKTIFQMFPEAEVESVTLVEPLIINYTSHSHCTYTSGRLEVTTDKFVDTILVSSPVEQMEFHHVFDVAIQINVIEHVQDGLMFLTKVYNALKPGGLLIFHERLYEDPEQLILLALGHFELHPIRIKHALFKQFFQAFDTPLLYNTEPTRDMIGRGYGEEAVYFIAVKL